MLLARRVAHDRQFLHNVGALSRKRAYLGSFSLTQSQPEVAAYMDLSEAILKEFPDGSIVNMSIMSAIEGYTGDHHRSARTFGSKLFINPLMAQYWCFEVDAVARRCLYMKDILGTQTYAEIAAAIRRFRASIHPLENESLPM